MRRNPPVVLVLLLLGLYLVYRIIAESKYMLLYYIVSIPSTIIVISFILSELIKKRRSIMQLRLYEEKFEIYKSKQKEIEKRKQEAIVAKTIEKKSEVKKAQHKKPLKQHEKKHVSQDKKQKEIEGIKQEVVVPKNIKKKVTAKKLQREASPQSDYSPKQIAKKIKCTRCGADMVLRTARHGIYKGNRFYGCRNFPKCKNIVPVHEHQAGESIERASIKPTPPNCPFCGIEMVLRTAKRGRTPGKKFYGCRNFPECRRIMKAADL